MPKNAACRFQRPLMGSYTVVSEIAVKVGLGPEAALVTLGGEWSFPADSTKVGKATKRSFKVGCYLH